MFTFPVSHWSSGNQYSMTFDGVDEDVNIGNTSTLDFTTNFSGSAWIKLSALALGVILFRSTSSPFQGYTFEVTSAGKLRVVINGGAGGLGITTSSTVLSTNTWYHAAFTKASGAAPKIYVNGSETAYDNSDSTNPTANTSDFRIGGTGLISGWTGRQFNGKIDEASMWNTNLTDANITSIYNSGKPTNLLNHPASANLVGWWKMGDGATFSTNWTIPDDSTNNNAGTSVNMEESDRTTDRA